MANFKPYPKTQREISEGLQTPFDSTRGNPNLDSNPTSTQTGIDFNRSEKLVLKKILLNPLQ